MKKKTPLPSPDLIRAVRLSAGLTRAEAAALIGYTERAWQSWELGMRIMRPVMFELFKERANEH